MIRDEYGYKLPYKHDIISWKRGVFQDEDLESPKELIGTLSRAVLDAEKNEEDYELKIDSMKAYMVYIAIVGFFSGLFLGYYVCTKVAGV